MDSLLVSPHELPFRHLFDYNDGKTTGPSSFSGNKIEPDLLQLTVVKFKLILGSVPVMSSETAEDL